MKTILALTALLLVSTSSFADDWPQFRGPRGAGVSKDAAPLEWGPGKNVRWKVDLPDAGNSSPIVSNGRVFLTVAENRGKKRSLLCLDRKTGKVLWTQSVAFTGIEPSHGENPYCGSTPCADGERVVVWHSSAGAHCYDFSGKKLWSANLGAFAHIWGYGSSPVMYGDLVILNCGPGDRTFLIALDKRTGKTVWKQEESGGDSKKWIGSWATPLIVGVDGKDQIVISYPDHVKGYDPATGEVLWTCGGFGKLAYADVVLGDGVAVATGEDEAGESIGFRLGGRGDVTGSHRLWARKRPLEVSTGIIRDGRLWTVDNGGILRCTDVKTGEEVHKERAPHGAAWGSMVEAGGHVYFTSKSGETVVFQPDPKGVKVVAVNTLGERSNSTPAFSGGEIFLRTHKSVACISEKR